MANLIIKPSAGGDLKLQDEGSTDAITISTTGNTTLAGTANNLGTVATMTLPVASATAVYPTGTVIKTTFDISTERVALSGGGGNGVVQALWNDIAVTKLLSSTDLICHVAMAARAGSNGYSTWYMRAGSNSWVGVGGIHNYIGTNAISFPLIGKIPAADTSAGNNLIDIGWSTGTGKPFTVWNPDSSDHAEFTGGSNSAITIQEIMV